MQASADWNDLKYFLAIQRSGTLAGAARILKVDQTTVGRRLRTLEEAYDARLFDRTEEGFALTVSGERIFELAREVEERMSELALRVAGENRRPEGTVRLATSEVLSFGFLLEHLVSLRERHPGIDLELVTGSAAVNLSRREADLALRLGATRVTQANVLVRKLTEVPWSLYATKKYLAERGPVRLGEGLTGHDVVAFDEELLGISPARWLSENAGAARRVLVANGILAMSRAAAAGFGLTTLPCFLGAALPELARATPGNITTASAWLLVHSDLARTARVRTVMDFLVEIFHKHRDHLEGR
jgi:DNA-binding transcriptional LysR family regulator